MLKALRFCLIDFLVICSIISIAFSVSICSAMTLQEYMTKHETGIEAMCEYKWVKVKDHVEKDLYGLMAFPGHYECGLTQFYALNRVVDIVLSLQQGSDEEGSNFFDELLDRHHVVGLDTYDFVAIHIDWEEYMENR
jgi:hypothetical protein